LVVDIAVPIQMRYNIISPGVGARQCRALTGVPHACREPLYSGSRLTEVQEPHPQPPPRSSRGGYDIRKRYKFCASICLTTVSAE